MPRFSAERPVSDVHLWHKGDILFAKRDVSY